MRPDYYARNYLTTWRIFRRNQKGVKYEPEAPYMEYMCQPGDTCLHFGASDGRHAYLLSQYLNEDGVIHAYEPSRYSYKIMDRLIRWHGVKNIIPHNAAIGAKEGRSFLNVPKKLSGHMGRAYAVIGDHGRGSEPDLAQANSTDFERQETDVVSLDGIVEREGFSEVHFIRCDIEGAETLMIEGGRKTLERDLPALLIEIHPFSLKHNFGVDPEGVKNYFRELGYRMWRLDDDDKELIETWDLDEKRRWRDYFLVHPDRTERLPDGPFKS